MIIPLPSSTQIVKKDSGPLFPHLSFPRKWESRFVFFKDLPGFALIGVVEVLFLVVLGEPEIHKKRF